MGAERLPAPKRSSLCPDAGSLWRSRARGCGVSGANLACGKHRYLPDFESKAYNNFGIVTFLFFFVH